MRIVFSQMAWEEYQLLQSDRRLVKRVNQSIADILRGGNSGIGKPEQLSGDLVGFWSRRIDERHRLVYRLVDDSVEVAQCHGHYSDR
jgi:toxin YoeB